MTINDNNSLAHYGVPGMKWGKRKARGSAPKSEDAAKADRYKARVRKSGVSSLSNKELKALNERINLEKSFNEVKIETYSSGKKATTKVLKKSEKIVVTAIATVAAQQVASLIKSGISSAIKVATSKAAAEVAAKAITTG